MRGSSTRFMRAPRMLVVVCSSTWVVMASPHRRRVDGLDDVLVAGAAADVALEPAPDLRLGQPVAVRAEKLDAGHDHPRGAEAALERVALPEGLLERMQLAAPRETLVRRDCTPYDGDVKIGSVEEVERALGAESYLPDRGLATAIYLAVAMQRPLLLEGEAGVGKTEVGKTLARVLDAELIRLQCYEGIDSAQALYEWDYARQLLYARALQSGDLDPSERAAAAEAIDWAQALALLGADRVDEASARDTLGWAVKNHDDLRLVERILP